MSDITRATILVSGIVQGVCYRSSAAEAGLALMLVGSAKNLPDGRVQVITEGDKSKIEELIKWCHDGPPAAEVSAVETKWENPTGEFQTFAVKL